MNVKHIVRLVLSVAILLPTVSAQIAADAYDKYTSVGQLGLTVTNHEPLGISVHLESCAWNFPFADAFVILNYSIKNISNEVIEDVYAGVARQNKLERSE